MLLPLLITLASLSSPAFAATSLYRLSWRDDPATTMVVGWAKDRGGSTELRYGTDPKAIRCADFPNSRKPDRKTRFAKMDHEFARLEGLTPDTRYFFAVCDRDGPSEPMNFRTAPSSPDARFSLIAGGDSRNNRKPRQNANRMVAKLRPLAVLFGGDMNAKGSAREWRQWLQDWQLTRSEDGRMVPILAARGNHEPDNEFLDKLFDAPHPDGYYAFTFGQDLLRVYTLNTEIAITGHQTDWLRHDLETNRSTRWKIAQYHRPMRPHVRAKKEGANQYRAWAGLFHEAGVDLAVECDAHTVKRTWPIRPASGPGSEDGFIRDDLNGTVYVGEGGWGAPLRSPDNRRAWTRDVAKFNGFHWIQVHGRERLEERTIPVDDVGLVAAKSEEEDPLSLPRGLEIWTPAEGAVATLYGPGPADSEDTAPGLAKDEKEKPIAIAKPEGRSRAASEKSPSQDASPKPVVEESAVRADREKPRS